RAQPLGEPGDLGGLARAVAALEGDEHSAHPIRARRHCETRAHRFGSVPPRPPRPTDGAVRPRRPRSSIPGVHVSALSTPAPALGPDPALAPPLRWGILAPGGIARKFATEVQAFTASRVVAVGSRS